MSGIVPGDTAAVVVRAAEAEVIGYPPQTVRLLADSSTCGGKLSTQRVTLNDGADGANPHHHATSAELFYVLGGSAQLLANRTDPALLTANRWTEVAQQYVAAGQELYSGYSSAAVAARSPRPADVHSAASA